VDEIWFEVWWDRSTMHPATIMLIGSSTGVSVQLFDPGEFKVLHNAVSYEDAVAWLGNQFVRVEGRMSWSE
jgi:hypothetical protein